MELKPGYMQSEAGVIPKDWRASTIGVEADLLTGFPFPSEGFASSGVRLLRGSNVKRGALDWRDDITEHWPSVPRELKKYELQDGDVVIAMDGALVGRSYALVAIEDLPALLVQRVARIRSRRADLRLLRAWIGSERFVRHVDSVKTHTAIPHISPRDIREFALALPPESNEQHAIAEALSDVDALLSGLDRLISKKRDVKQAAMQRLLTGDVRLPGFHGEWKLVRLGDVFTFKNGLNKSKQFFGHGTPIVNYMDVFRGSKMHSANLEGRVFVTKSELKNYDVRQGDVFFTRTSETIEEVGITSVMLGEPIDTVFSGFVLRARPLDDRLSDKFKAYCFSSAVVRKQITSKASYTTRALTNGTILSDVQLALPSFAEQAAIAAVLSDIDAEIDRLDQRRDKTRALKLAMMQELLTGQIRLVRPEAANV